MGRHFGIANVTKKMEVSSGDRCWKADDFCDCHEVMHRYHWDINDNIYSMCYDTYCEFEYKLDSGKMILHELHPSESSFELLDENNNKIKKVGFDAHDGDDNDDANMKTFMKQSKKTSEQTCDHAPIWDGNKCVTCNYIFDKLNIKKDERNFDHVFFMS